MERLSVVGSYMKELNFHSPVVLYITEEVKRQGHDVTELDGIRRVSWMLDGWDYALQLRDSVRRLPQSLMLKPLEN